ncbi:hypothetical protein Ato02nite_089350 [Paractinoplanes toevensis]|uniref:Uncharacterized protein n=1 Tax=Paractinoplanes toevensis TaxID=571911 RepID=A0A919WBL4_9ACTN|nr:hypothetical protein Ato02nite_089350 [Actinoplanes toevensis]
MGTGRSVGTGRAVSAYRLPTFPRRILMTTPVRRLLTIATLTIATASAAMVTQPGAAEAGTPRRPGQVRQQHP